MPKTAQTQPYRLKWTTKEGGGALWDPVRQRTSQRQTLGAPSERICYVPGSFRRAYGDGKAVNGQLPVRPEPETRDRQLSLGKKRNKQTNEGLGS